MPSKAYDAALAQMREFHRTRKTFSGNGVLKHKDALIGFSRVLDAASALDYGCGKGAQYRQTFAVSGSEWAWSLEGALGFDVFKYDPAVPEFNHPPASGQMFDLVWCVDVLECVPEEDMAQILDDIFSHATKGLFITVASYPSKKTLPNGENAHITIKSESWWWDQVDAARDRCSRHLDVILLVA